MPANYPLLVVLGPTGAGKSCLGLHLARHLDGEIVNFDSVQVYRGFDIGTAKLTVSERGNIPHHMIDTVDADQLLTAGTYARQAREALYAIRQRRKVPILAGGTGFYLRALLDGLSPAPPRANQYRARLMAAEAKRNRVLHRLLRCQDKQASERIHPNDIQKLIRALEIIYATKRPVTEVQSVQRATLQGFRTLKLGLGPPREALCDRLNQRAQSMFQGGLIEEVERLLQSGVSPSAKPFEALGYKQALRVVAGELRYEDAIIECQTKTRQYAKRQMTWFRRECGVCWLEDFGDQPHVQCDALTHAERFLASNE